jgi:hypothetical protein
VGVAIVAVFGPLVSVQAIDERVVPPVPVTALVRVTELVGRVIVWLLPTVSVGLVMLNAGELTVTETVLVAAAPVLSLTVN